jgi:hypothetical protein
VTSAVTQYTTRLLTPNTWDEFAALVEANNGVWGGCWCIGFHPEGISKDSTAAGNREAKLTHVNNGTIHQMLVYRDGRCVGRWPVLAQLREEAADAIDRILGA